MNAEAYARDQNILISRLRYYMLFTLLEEAFFALASKYSPELIENPKILLAPFSAIMAKFIFITYALINKNIFQINAYLSLIVFSTTMVCIGLIKSTFLGRVFTLITILVLFLDGSYTIYLIKKLREIYLWHFYKKLGLSEELQYVNKLKQRLNVFFRLDVFLSITCLQYPITTIQSVSITNYIGYVLTVLSAFFYTQWLGEENRPLRIATIVMVIVKFILVIFDIIKIATRLKFFLNMFIMISLIYSALNNVLYATFLYLDMKTYGNNYNAELMKNVRQKRGAFETVKPNK